MEESQEVKVEVPIELCHKIMDNLQDSIERLEIGTNTLQHCLDDLSEVVNPGFKNLSEFMTE